MLKMQCGVEIEATGFNRTVGTEEEFREDWDKKSDGSVNGDALEFVSHGPKDPVKTMQMIEDFYKNEVGVDMSCGIHFHFSIMKQEVDGSLKQIGSEAKSTLANRIVAIAGYFEKELFALMPSSRQNNRFCKRITQALKPTEKTARKKLGRITSHKYNNNARYCWLNLVELWRNGGLGTVEFRLLGNTKRPEFVMAWFNVCAAIVYGALRFDPLHNADAIKDVFASIEEAIRLCQRVSKPGHGVNGQDVTDATMRNINEIVSVLKQNTSKCTSYISIV